LVNRTATHQQEKIRRIYMKKRAILLGTILLCFLSALCYAQLQSPILNQLGALTASDGWPGDNLGGGVAIDGNTVVASGVGWNGSGSGVGYVFVEPSTRWASMTQTAKLTTSDGSPIGAVAISGNTVVAAPVWGGAGYVFVEPSTGWADMTETAKLTTSDGSAIGAVAISGNTVVAIGGSGAYVFVKPLDGWGNMTETAVLTTSNGDGLTGVAISGSTVAAGAVWGNNGNGAAYVFVEPAGGWANMTQTAELTAFDGASDDFLGCGVGISGDTVVAGAPNHTINGNGWQGAVYVFAKPTSGWANMTQTAELTASDGGFTDQLGNGAAIYGDTVVGGAPQYEPFGNTGNGKAYAYFKPAGGWTNMTESEELVASWGKQCDALGGDVAISGGTVVAGAPGECAGGGSSGKPGAAYVFGVCPSTSGAALCQSTLTFATQSIYSTSNPQNITLRNTGTDALEINSITASANFSQTNNCGSSVGGGGSCTISVSFAPQAIGTLTGSVTITDNAANSPQTVSLTGVGTLVTLNPWSLGFGGQPVGTTSPPLSVTLTNHGFRALDISGIGFMGPDAGEFAQTNTCGTTVAARSTCTLSVTFTPQGSGLRTATLGIKDNGGGSPQTLPLKGEGK
jgi:hypothetical protein